MSDVNNIVGLTDAMTDVTTVSEIEAKGHIIEVVTFQNPKYSYEVDANFDSSRRVLTLANSYAIGFAKITVQLL